MYMCYIRGGSRAAATSKICKKIHSNKSVYVSR